jgi:hypothetical protein
MAIFTLIQKRYTYPEAKYGLLFARKLKTTRFGEMN